MSEAEQPKVEEAEPQELDGVDEKTDEEKATESELGPEEANDDGPEEDEADGDEETLEDDDDGPEEEDDRDVEDPSVPPGISGSDVIDEPAD